MRNANYSADCNEVPRAEMIDFWRNVEESNTAVSTNTTANGVTELDRGDG